MKPLFHLLLGTPFLLLGLFLLTGKPLGGLALLGESMNCTQGGSLLFWLPVTWGMGLLIHRFVDQFPRLVLSPKQAKPLSPDDQAIVTYIQQATKRGLSQSQIATRLRAKGWTPAEIEARLSERLS